MQKHIYCSPIPTDMYAECEYFEVNGEAYEFHIEVNVEDQFVRVTDAIGRMLPVDVDHMDSFIAAMERARDMMTGLPNVTTVDSEGYIDFEG